MAKSWLEVNYTVKFTRDYRWTSQQLLHEVLQKEGTKKVESFAKGMKMLSEMCLEACPVLPWERRYFFIAIARASMKKQAQYCHKSGCNVKYRTVWVNAQVVRRFALALWHTRLNSFAMYMPEHEVLRVGLWSVSWRYYWRSPVSSTVLHWCPAPRSLAIVFIQILL